MYMHEGKPIAVPYGRRNVNVTRLEFQDALAALAARIEALEGGAVVTTGYASTVEPGPVMEQETDEHDPGPDIVAEAPKPRRGRPPKEVTE